MRKINQFNKCRDGASAVEFAIVAPVLLLILFGIIIFGIVIILHSNLQQLAGEAARASVPGLSQQERVAFARNYVSKNINAYPFIESKLLKVSTKQLSGKNSAFRVTVSYNLANSRVGSITKLLLKSEKRIERSAVVLLGGMGG